jgi:hypothetical protein
VVLADVGLLRLAQRVAAADVDLQVAVPDLVEPVVGVLEQQVTGADVVGVDRVGQPDAFR